MSDDEWKPMKSGHVVQYSVSPDGKFNLTQKMIDAGCAAFKDVTKWGEGKSIEPKLEVVIIFDRMMSALAKEAEQAEHDKILYDVDKAFSQRNNSIYSSAANKGFSAGQSMSQIPQREREQD